MKKLLLLLTILVTAVGYAYAETKQDVFKSASWFTTTSPGSATEKTETSTTTGVKYTYKQVYKNTNIGLMLVKSQDSYIKFTAPFAFSKLAFKTGANSSDFKVNLKVGDTTIKSSIACSKASTISIEIPSEYQKADIEFTLEKVKDGKNGQIADFTYTIVEAPVLGEPGISYVVGENTISVANGDNVEVEAGTVFTFACENAESIVATLGEEYIVDVEGASATWTATPCQSKEVTAMFALGNDDKTVEFTLTVNAASADLGDVVVKYGDVVIPNAYGQTDAEAFRLPVGASVTVSCANATTILMQKGQGENYESNNNIGNPATITFDAVGECPVTLIPAREANDPQSADKTFYFVAEVYQPVAGDIVAVYGADNTAIAADDEITVEEGTKFTFTSTDATVMTLEALADDDIILLASSESGTLTWTADRVFSGAYVSVTASIGGEKASQKTFDFMLTVTESMHEIWTLVTSVDELECAENVQYIIANSQADFVAMSNKNKENNRDVETVTISDNSLVDPSANVLRLTLELDGKDYLWKTVNYLGEDGKVVSPQVYLNAKSGENRLYASNPKTANLDGRNTSVSFTDSYAKIVFVNQAKENVNYQIFYNPSSKNGNLFNTYAATTETPATPAANNTRQFVRLYKHVFPAPAAPEAPDLDMIEEDNTKVAVVLKNKEHELHVLETTYVPAGAGNAETEVMCARAAEELWTNKVETDADGRYEIAVPETGLVKLIRAKSVANGQHSPELTVRINAQGGQVSAIEAVEADGSDAPAEYFDLQGRRVEPAAAGIYLRRQGSKVEKVVVR